MGQSAISAQGRSAPQAGTPSRVPTYRSVTPATPRPALSPARALYTRVCSASTHTASTLSCRRVRLPCAHNPRAVSLRAAAAAKSAGRRWRCGGGRAAPLKYI